MYGPLFGPPGSVGRDTRPDDRASLHDVFVAAVLGLVGAVISLVALFGSAALNVFESHTTSSGSTSYGLNQTALATLGLLVAIGVVLELIELGLYYRAFTRMAGFDIDFATPAKLTLLLLISVILSLGLFVGLVAGLEQALICSGGSQLDSACISLGAFLALLVGLLIVEIIALIGFFGGLVLGTWRLGYRYNDGLFRVGAILTIFPVLNIVGQILIIVAARRSRGKHVRRLGPLGMG